MKKLFVIALAALMLVPTVALAKKTTKKTSSEEVVEFKETAKVYMFRGEGCPHCEEALEYFDSIKDKYDFELITYEVWYDEDNKKILNDVAEGLGKEVGGVPFIVIGKTVFSGYSESYNKDIEEAIKTEGVNGNANESVSKYANGAKEDEKKSKNSAIIIISVLVVAGVVALIILGRKTATEE